MHFLVQCPSFVQKRRCYFGKLKSTGLDIEFAEDYEKVATMLCPTTVKQAKLINKFIEIMFKCRKQVDEGATIESLKYYDTGVINDPYSDLDNSLNNSLDSNCNNFGPFDTDD